MTRRVAITVPRYGPSLVGGMERLARGLLTQMAARGWQIELLTTTALDHHTFKAALPTGMERSGAQTIRRFPVVWRDATRYRQLETRLVTTGALSPAEQEEWLFVGPHSPTLYDHLARHAAAYDLIFCLPYASSMMQLAAWVAPERTLFIPCLHAEPYAAMAPLRALLNSVWGVAWNSPEEAALAREGLAIAPQREAVVGVGVDPLPPVADAVSPADARALLYCGRLEAGKNLGLLYRYLQRYHDEGSDLRLWVAGDGPLRPPDHPAFRHLGWLTAEEQARTYRRALALCQPSRHESFSLTVMESWRAARPVLVHDQCAVTRGHVTRANGGLWFNSYDEFASALDWLKANPAAAQQMGRNGARYVSANYEWESVMDRLEALVEPLGVTR
ncbi:MAG: glycosyltransferase family 4 protein [Anaerolineales bacterium]|nr:glycosyltransferase family 4 protein [Anaerolineales bacterium]